MRMKYYLRGLGVGIITATLILSVFMQKEEKITDEEVMARAKELGMVMAEEGEIAQEEDSGVLRAVVPKTTEVEQETELKEEPETSEKEGDWETAAETVTEDEKELSEPEKQESDTEEEGSLGQDPDSEMTSEETAAERNDSEKIRISEGDSSYAVADKLETAGLVEKASEFDRYLIDSGYEKYIRPGEYLIPKGTQPSEIVKIIASR